jgi:protein phosphatase
MAEVQVLYVVTAAVVVALAVWLFVVLTRMPPISAASSDGAAPQDSPPSPLGEGSARELGGLAAAPAEPRPPARSVAGASKPPPSADGADISIDSATDDDDPTGPQALILVTAVGRTDPGLKRKHNEDAYVIVDEHHLFVIADGMGRHAAGEVASQLCVEAVAETFRHGKFDAFPQDPMLPRRANMLAISIKEANDRIYQKASTVDEYHGMGTTAVAAYFSPGKQRVYIAHVGDSRCYRLRDGTLKQLTKDHTLGAAGIQGKSSNVLSRAVGVEDSVDVDVTMESPLPGDVYLLCSDGLSRMATDDEIRDTLAQTSDLEDASKKLIDLANSRGGRDNITNILIRVDAPKV